jgi:protein-tyrosine-phosphatase
VSLADHRSRPVDRAQIAAADWILVMDLDQRRRLLAVAPEARAKVELFGRFIPDRGASPEILDPMDCDLATFRRVYGQLAIAVRHLAMRFRAA